METILNIIKYISTNIPKVKIKQPTELDTKALNTYNLRVKSYTHYAYNVPKNIYMADPTMGDLDKLPIFY